MCLIDTCMPARKSDAEPAAPMLRAISLHAGCPMALWASLLERRANNGLTTAALSWLSRSHHPLERPAVPPEARRAGTARPQHAAGTTCIGLAALLAAHSIVRCKACFRGVPLCRCYAMPPPQPLKANGQPLRPFRPARPAADVPAAALGAAAAAAAALPAGCVCHAGGGHCGSTLWRRRGAGLA